MAINISFARPPGDQGPDPEPNRKLAAALKYARAGWPVFPLHTPTGKPDQPCSCNRRRCKNFGKHPCHDKKCSDKGPCDKPCHWDLCKNVGKHPRTIKGKDDATTDEAKIRQWWEIWPAANIGGLTGPKSGRWAFDIDPRNGGADSLLALKAKYGDLPSTQTQLTGGLGNHYLFKWPERFTGKMRGDIGAGLDIKADGYIVLAPSDHESGNKYKWLGAAELADAPEWLFDLAKKTETAGLTAGPIGDAIPEGKRNSTLASLAGSMRRRGMGADEIHAALLVTNEKRCDPPLSAGEVRKIAESVGRYAPADEDSFRAAGQSAGAKAAPGADSRAGEEANEDTGKNGAGKDPLSLLLIKLALGNSELFHDAGGDCYASVVVNGHRETHKLGSRDYKDWLAGLLYRTSERAATADKIGEAITVLRAKARYDAAENEVHVRVAEHEGAIYLDLCDKEWRQVKITEEDWGVIESHGSPIRFCRAKGMLPLPSPVRGGDLGELRALLNLPENDKENWPVILGWLVAAFRPCNSEGFDYPLLALHGEQGAAKSSAQRLLRDLVDPNKATLRAAPKDERDLAIAAQHGRIISCDNLTHLTENLSNAFCRLATGGGFATRELFTDEGEVIFDAQRPVILNGIAEVVVKSDLLDRTILVYFQQIQKNKRLKKRVESPIPGRSTANPGRFIVGGKRRAAKSSTGRRTGRVAAHGRFR